MGYQIEEKYPIDIREFNDFVADQYKLTSPVEGWPQLVLKHCKRDEEKAIQEFFGLLQLFKAKYEQVNK